jgi:uncharacterized protein (TIGR00288 family)
MNHIAIFIDAENLTNWVKNNGVQSLMDELLPLGQIVVRKAYGKWSSRELISLQSVLNENGFELVHTFHPVSGKNSTDIKMTVDTMEVALDSQVQWIVLATGDSDFSPLFRKLREQGKEVIGVGPKSPLSECVKNSCSRYIYTDDATSADDDANDEDSSVAKDRSSLMVSERIDSMEMLRTVLQKEDGPIALAAIKPKMLGIDNAFNEKRLGFKTFKDFVKSADFVQMTDVGGGSYTVALDEQKVAVEEDPQMILAKALKRKGWDMFPRNMLKKIYAEACDITSFVPMCKQDLVQEIVSKNIAGTTSSIINRALGTFFKAKLVTISGGDDKLWTINETNQYWKEIDKAMLDRLRVSLKETGQKVSKKDIVAILYGKYADGEAEKLV